jgi:hypothetical protein
MGSGTRPGTDRDQGTARPFGRDPRGEGGNILVLFALSLTMFMLLCAVVIDVGYWWVTGKKAQIAADACALAAAGELPKVYADDPECVIEEVGGPDYVLTNLPDQSNPNEGPRHLSTRVRSPYNGDSSLVEATVQVRVGTFFGKIVGYESVDLTRRAVAERLYGEGDIAIYSHSSQCPEDAPPNQGESLQFNGNNHWVNGRVHSNGEWLVNNGGPEPFWAKVGTRIHCVSLQPHNQIRFGGDGWSTGQTKPDDVGPAPLNWPEFFNPAEFGWPTCSGAAFSGQKIEISDTELKVTGRPNLILPIVNGRRVIPSGTYCATELFTLSGNHMDGNITALAPKIEVQGNDLHFTPYAPNGVLFFQVANINTFTDDDGEPDGKGPLYCQFTNEMLLSNGNAGQWKGKVFHPCGQIRVNGNDASGLEGAIYGLRVRVNGNGFNMTGKGGGGPLRDTALVE